MAEVVESLGVSRHLQLDSKRAVGFQARLPNNQWQLEAEHWFTASLADLQRMVVDQATGPIDTNVNRGRRRPQAPEEYLICSSQKIRNDSFTSFDTLGLVIILGVGALMIIVSYTLEYIIHRIQIRRNFGTYERLEWITNETLQMKRLAHEEAG